MSPGDEDLPMAWPGVEAGAFLVSCADETFLIARGHAAITHLTMRKASGLAGWPDGVEAGRL